MSLKGIFNFSSKDSSETGDIGVTTRSSPTVNIAESSKNPSPSVPSF